MSLSKKLLILLLLSMPVPFVDAATVLIYHHVSNTMPASTSIVPDRFIAQMDYLEKNNYHMVPLTELVDKLHRNEPLPDKTVAITFDDSYTDVYSAAYPILKKRHWPFTFFVNTDAVNSGKLFVTWDQLREMAKHGVTIANHTTKHNHIVRLDSNETLAQWRVRIAGEITDAQTRIEKEIGSAPKILAYPFGEYNTEIKQLVNKLGYTAFTQQAGVLDPDGDLQALPRFPFGGSFTELNDFIEKINTLPMPIKSVEFYADKNQKLADMVVKANTKPYLVLSLKDDRLLDKINCFASGEGKINTHIIEKKLWVQTTKPFPAGRTKINCTAPSAEKGRYYWYTQLWLVTDADGKWTYQD